MYLNAQGKHHDFNMYDKLFVSDRDSDLIVSYCIENFESLCHGDEIARVIKVHECPPKLGSLPNA